MTRQHDTNLDPEEQIGQTLGEVGMEPEPEKIVQLILRGDRYAESDLFQMYRRGIHLLIRNRVKDDSAAEDILQDTFRIVIEKIRAGAVRDPARISGFICSVARNRVIEHFRREDRRAQVEQTAQHHFVSEAPLSPLERLDKESQAALVRQVLNELSLERDRDILYRFYIKEESKTTICEDLKLTSLHFNRVLFRARQRYRELYELRHGEVRSGVREN